MSGIEQYFDLKPQVLELDKKALELCAPEFAKVEAIRDENQWRMLRAFTDNKVSATQLVGSTGYGYDDAGREKLDRVFADLVGAEDALCRSHFLSGTHALTVACLACCAPAIPCWPPPAAPTIRWKASSALTGRARALARWRITA